MSVFNRLVFLVSLAYARAHANDTEVRQAPDGLQTDAIDPDLLEEIMSVTTRFPDAEDMFDLIALSLSGPKGHTHQQLLIAKMRKGHDISQYLLRMASREGLQWNAVFQSPEEHMNEVKERLAHTMYEKHTTWKILRTACKETFQPDTFGTTLELAGGGVEQLTQIFDEAEKLMLRAKPERLVEGFVNPEWLAFDSDLSLLQRLTNLDWSRVPRIVRGFAVRAGQSLSAVAFWLPVGQFGFEFFSIIREWWRGALNAAQAVRNTLAFFAGKLASAASAAAVKVRGFATFALSAITAMGADFFAQIAVKALFETAFQMDKQKALSDAYQVLGLESNATRKEVYDRYQELRITHNPELDSSNESMFSFLKFTEAYEVIHAESILPHQDVEENVLTDEL